MPTTTFDPRKDTEDLTSYLARKKAFDIQQTGQSGITLPTPAPLTALGGTTKATATQTITIPNWKKGGTLSDLALKYGTTVENLQKLNNLTGTTIYEGRPLIVPGSSGGANGINTNAGTVSDFSGVGDSKGATEMINSDQQNDADSLNANGEPTVKKTTQDIIKEITTAVTPTTAAPTNPDYTGTLNTYRSTYGVTDLETQLDTLRNEEQGLQAQKRIRTNAERGKTVAMNVIEGRVGEVERQENERIDAVQRSIANTTNQLNTKYNIINSLMKTKEMDYASAVASYDKQMATNISIFNAATNIEEANKTEIEHQKDDARSNAQIIINAMNDKGITYDQLSTSEQANLTKLGVQSGLGANFFSNVMKISSGKSIFTTITSADDTMVSVIYKDGTKKTFSTGLPAKSTNDKLSEGEALRVYTSSMASQLESGLDNDSVSKDFGYLSPSKWLKAKKLWISKSGYTGVEFDKAFKSYVNPSHPGDYSGYEGYLANFAKPTTAAQQLIDILNQASEN